MKVMYFSVQCRETYMIAEEPGVSYITSFVRAGGHDCQLYSFYFSQIDYDRIAKFSPQFIGMPIYDANARSILELCKVLKNKFPSTYLCLGGYYATEHYDSILVENPYVDFVVRGEGEKRELQLINALEVGGELDRIDGLVYRNKGVVKINHFNSNDLIDLSLSPQMDRATLEEYVLPEAVMSTTRGCLRNCAFCNSKYFWKKWRGRTAKQVIDEIKEIHSKYNIAKFVFYDNSFEDDNSRDHYRCQQIADNLIELNLPIIYSISLRAESFKDYRMIDKLVRSGVYSVFIGIEAGNEADLKLYRKTATLTENALALRACKENEIFAETGFICINPYSTLDTLRQNVDFIHASQLGADFKCFTNKFKKYNGTFLNDRLIKDDMVTDNDDCYGYRFMTNEAIQYDRAIKMLNVQSVEDKLTFWNRSYLRSLFALLIFAKRKGNLDLIDLTRFEINSVQRILTHISDRNVACFSDILSHIEQGMAIEQSYIDTLFCNENYSNYLVELENRSEQFRISLANYTDASYAFIIPPNNYVIT